MRIVVNWAACDGNGNCASAAPALFSLDTNGELQVLRETVTEEYRGQAEAAVSACPKNALRLNDGPAAAVGTDGH